MVGAVVFLILVIIQFVVITKGAERVAEVAPSADAARKADGHRRRPQRRAHRQAGAMIGD